MNSHEHRPNGEARVPLVVEPGVSSDGPGLLQAFAPSSADSRFRMTPRRRAATRAALVLICALWAATTACEPQGRFVVVYASQDQVYAEPLLRRFTEKTGIEARAVYDSEAVKTVGMANRLIAERERPVADVFWGNEELRTRQLDQMGLFETTPGWASIGWRSRCLIHHTNLAPNPPLTLAELTNATWKGRVALAYPMFGSTATHFVVLRQRWGEEAWLRWCRALQANSPLLLEGNSQVAHAVAAGRAHIGLTDTDDYHEETNGRPHVARVPLSSEFLRLPNTVAIVKGGPHPLEARALQEFLRSPEVASLLVSQHALEGAEAESKTSPPIDWPRLVRELGPAMDQLGQVFLR
ncbi:MAG: substrate-binding domain-containing protein [Verrucomicrobia bacterium]|nr:substrate-binding domain-containing protein [Verrucomicrobiota bacterium]MBI3867599.1 substrate-binding domain-containing protein [Verrucomicrobiota bacterium]